MHNKANGKIFLLAYIFIFFCFLTPYLFSQNTEIFEPFLIMNECARSVLTNSIGFAFFYEEGEKSLRLVPAYTFGPGYGIFHIGVGFTYCVIEGFSLFTNLTLSYSDSEYDYKGFDDFRYDGSYLNLSWGLGIIYDMFGLARLLMGDTGEIDPILGCYNYVFEHVSMPWYGGVIFDYYYADYYAYYPYATTYRVKCNNIVIKDYFAGLSLCVWEELLGVVFTLNFYLMMKGPIMEPVVTVTYPSGGTDDEVAEGSLEWPMGFKFSLLFVDHFNVCFNYIIWPQYEDTFPLIISFDYKW